jgi:hypothetical protein
MSKEIEELKQRIEDARIDNFNDIVRTVYKQLTPHRVTLTPDKARRSCLRCRVVFLSSGKGNRTCASCAEYISRTPKHARFMTC